MQHVRNQFKGSLAEFVEAFKDVSFSHPGHIVMRPENGFGFYCADFILDNDLDVWLIEPHKHCGLKDDYNFLVEMNDQLLSGVLDTLVDVWQKEEHNKPMLPLENTGGWEIIFGDRWHFKYDGYERSSSKRDCDYEPLNTRNSLRST